MGTSVHDRMSMMYRQRNSDTTNVCFFSFFQKIVNKIDAHFLSFEKVGECPYQSILKINHLTVHALLYCVTNQVF